MTTPTMFLVDKKLEDEKSVYHEKSLSQKCINSFLAHMLLHNRWLWFFLGDYGSLQYPALQFGGACGLGVGAW